MAVSVVFFVSCLTLALTGIEGGELSTCARNYDKVGCYDERNASPKDLLVNDRSRIQWDNIVGYIHHLACTCEAKARDVNKERRDSEKYVGFALHFWGECYGRTQAQMDSLASRSKSARCTGDQTYTKCYDKNPECTGHGFSEFVFKLKAAITEPPSIMVPMNTAIQCNTENFVYMGCGKGKVVDVRKVSYGRRTSTRQCGNPLSSGWETKCGSDLKETFNYFKNYCSKKSVCFVENWYRSYLDPCPKVMKFLEVKYTCKNSM